MSGPLTSASAAFVAKNSRKPPYAIEQSLRFDSGQTGTLTRTPSSNGGSVHTTSAWIKAADSTLMANIFAAYPSESAYGTSTTYDILGWYSEGPYSYIGNGPGNESALYLGAIDYSYKFRDTSAWYHVIWVSTSTQFEIYVNGVLVASKSRTQNNSYYNQNKPHRISAYRAPNGSVLGYINCYMAEVHFVDGTALDPTDLGEYDEFGVWRPIEYTGTYGNNGFYLKFDPSAANGIGHDHSGNGNNWTASGFTTSGTGTDVMSDTPTNNHCTWNPLSKSSNSPAPTDGNLRGGLPGAQNGTFAVSSGKWYWETKYISGNGYAIATGVGAVDLAQPAGGFSTGIIYYGGTGGTYGNDMGLYNFSGSPDTSYGTGGFWTGGHFGVMLDLDSSPQTIAFSKDGTTYSTVNIPSDKQGLTYVPVAQGGSASTTGSWDLFVDENTWTYTPPTGFKALNTSNLPAPTVKDGSDYFNTVLYTGNGSTQSITGVGFQPDFTWIKKRGSSGNHMLTDAVRGANTEINSNTTAAETSNTNALTSFDTDGFSVGADGAVNINNEGLVAWNWLAGGSGSSNTDGSITSTVSANPTAGFSIVKSQLAGSAVSATYGHGLGVAPKFLIVKPLNTFQWDVYHEDLGNTAYLILNDTAAQTTGSSTVWNSTSPTSTVFSLGTAWPTYAGINQDFIAYCFAEVEGYSKFGSYTGNASTDGPFIYTGFAVRWLMWKKSSSTSNWVIWDTERHPYNVADSVLFPNGSGAEETNAAYNYDLLSNGFKVRTGSATINDNGATYIYAAFAENPFGGSGVNPATAR